MHILVEPIQWSDEKNIQTAFAIRKEVFVVEQCVSEEEEYDEYESQCQHFLAYHSDPTLAAQPLAVGTARVRATVNGCKLERFAVLASHRQAGVGGALVQASLPVALEWIKNSVAAEPKIYLHAQLHAEGFYTKMGFLPYGEHFFEAGIEHIAMYYPLSK